MKYWLCSTRDDLPMFLMRSRGIYTTNLHSVRFDRQPTPIETKAFVYARQKANAYCKEHDLKDRAYMRYLLLDPCVSELRRAIYPAILAVINEVELDSLEMVQTVLRMSYEEVGCRLHLVQEVTKSTWMERNPILEDPFKEAGCRGKKSFTTMADACKQRDRINGRYSTIGHVTAYHCRYCNLYHIGRGNNLKPKHLPQHA